MAKGFVKGAILLTICAVIGKIIGAFYRIPFSYIVGAEGVGLYQLVYPFFALMITISTSGLPSSISKLLSEQWAKGNYSLAKKTFKYSMLLLIVLSAVGSIVIAALAWPISKLQGNTNAWSCYVAISPAVFFVGILSGFRGYFQATGNMVPTALSGIIEQVSKLVFGLGLAYIFKQNVVSSTIGALLGVTISEICACIYMLIHYVIAKRKQVVVVLKDMPVDLTRRQIIKNILSIALPIALGSLIMPLTLMIDSGLIVKILSRTMPISQATTLYGLQSGVVGSLSNMPVVASVAIATAVLPQISKESAYKNKNIVADSVKTSMQFVLLVALPCAICFYIFSEQLVLFLYSKTFSLEEIQVCSRLLKIGSINIVLLSFAQVASSVLQGLGKVKVPMYALLVGAVVKIISLAALVNIPSINIYGAEISDAICYLVVMSINLFVIHKNIQYNNLPNLAKITLVAAVVGLVAYVSNILVYPQLSATISLLIAGGITVIVYALFVLVILNSKKRSQIKFAYQKVNKKRK